MRDNGVILHAYVLMENHYHLLIETPQGNAIRALQWLNVVYGARMHGGMTLAELARHAGMQLDTVNKSVPRMRQPVKMDAQMKRHHVKVMQALIAGKGALRNA